MRVEQPIRGTAESAAPMSDDRPLAGIKVVDAGTYIAGPLGALALADLGADVIKVEAPSGDPCRSYGPGKNGLSAIWVNANRGKTSISLDLKSDEGKAALFELLSGADLFIENWRPKVVASLGIEKEVLQKLNPALIRISVTGYGSSGPLADDPVFDALIQGSTGIVASPQHGASPDVATFFVADKVTAMVCAQAALAALVKRARTGLGSHVEVAMLDSVAYFNFSDMFTHRTFLGSEENWVPPVSPAFQTEDGMIMLAPATGKHIAAVLDAINKSEWKAQLRNMSDKNQMVRTFFDMIRPELIKQTSSQLITLFRELQVPVGPVNDADAHFSDPQVVHNELYGETSSPVGTIRTIRYPAIFDGEKMVAKLGAPALNLPGAKQGFVYSAEA